MAEAVDLSSVKEKQVKDEPKEVAAIPVKTAFLVYVSEAGETIMDTDVNKPIIVDHSPHPDEVAGACSKVILDIQTQEVVQHTTVNVVNAMVQVAQQQMQMAQQQAQTAQLLNDPNFRR